MYVHEVTAAEVLRCRDRRAAELLIDAACDIDALAGDADLPRIHKRMARAVLRHPCHVVNILVDDVRRVRAELQGDAAKAHCLVECLADGNAPRKGKHTNAFVRREEIADFAARAVDEVETAGGQPRLDKYVAEERRCERRGGGGLVDNRVTRRECRPDLVCSEIHGEVERCNRADNTERTTDGERHPIAAAGRPRERHRLPAQALCLLGREDKCLIGAVDLTACVTDGLARLSRERLGELLAPLAHEICRMHDDLVAFVRAELHRVEGALRRVHRRAHLLFPCRADLRNHLAGRLVIDGERPRPRNTRAVNKHLDRFHFIVLPLQAAQEPRRSAENRPEGSSSALSIDPRAAHVSCFSL